MGTGAAPLLLLCPPSFSCSRNVPPILAWLSAFFSLSFGDCFQNGFRPLGLDIKHLRPKRVFFCFHLWLKPLTLRNSDVQPPIIMQMHFERMFFFLRGLGEGNGVHNCQVSFCLKMHCSLFPSKFWCKIKILLRKRRPGGVTWLSNFYLSHFFSWHLRRQINGSLPKRLVMHYFCGMRNFSAITIIFYHLLCTDLHHATLPSLNENFTSYVNNSSVLKKDAVLHSYRLR